MKLTKEQRAVMAEMGRKGGQATVSKGIGKLTKKRRKEIARIGVAARRKKSEESS